MAVTWAEGEIQATLVAAGSRLPFGGLCMRLQGLWLIRTQRLHRGDHEATWGHTGRGGLPSPARLVPELRTAPMSWGLSCATRCVLRKASARVTPLRPPNSSDRLWSAPPKDGGNRTPWSSNLPRFRGQQMVEPPCLATWLLWPGRALAACLWPGCCPLSASVPSRHVPAWPHCWNPPQGLFLNARLTVPWTRSALLTQELC